jgi:arylsulfate sulfotransferase
MRKLQVACCGLFVAISTAVISLGCGGGGGWPDPTIIVAATNNPSVAQYTIGSRPGSTAWIEFGEDTNYGRQTSVTPPIVGLGKALTVLVAGMKPGTTYHMRAHVDWYGGGSWVDQDRTFTTGAFPPPAPQFTVSRPNPGLTPQAGVELITLDTCFVSDLEGNIIWYYSAGAGTTAAGPCKLLPNGNLATLVVNATTGSSAIQEIDLAGNIIRQLTNSALNQQLAEQGYSISIANFHHDVLPLPNGHWIVLTNANVPYTDLPGYPGTTKVLGDIVIDLDPNWKPVWVWSSFDHLDVNRHVLGLPDWTHSNALVYTPNDGNLLLSMRNQSWILKLDYENGAGSGNVLWRLGNQGDFALSGGDPREWFYAQHFPSPVSISGSRITLAIFDDGDNRDLDEIGDMCGTPGNEPCYSRATIFKLDESTKIASLDWQFLPGLYTFWGGSINQLANGNVEFDMSEPFPQDPVSSLVTEVTQTDDPKVVWQMTIRGGNAYRAYRVPSLYPGVAWQ